MFEISDLKSKKLPELQDIAKGLNVSKYKTLKKLDLVNQILDVQASNPKATETVLTTTSNSGEEQNDSKPKRSRVLKEKSVPVKGERTPHKPKSIFRDSNDIPKTDADTISKPEEATTAVDNKENTPVERRPRPRPQQKRSTLKARRLKKV
jgi:transcription termination factor Rho